MGDGRVRVHYYEPVVDDGQLEEGHSRHKQAGEVVQVVVADTAGAAVGAVLVEVLHGRVTEGRDRIFKLKSFDLFV